MIKVKYITYICNEIILSLYLFLSSENKHKIKKIAVRRDGKSKVNDKQLQTANLVFDDKILNVNASKYGMITIIE